MHRSRDSVKRDGKQLCQGHATCEDTKVEYVNVWRSRQRLRICEQILDLRRGLLSEGQVVGVVWAGLVLWHSMRNLGIRYQPQRRAIRVDVD